MLVVVLLYHCYAFIANNCHNSENIRHIHIMSFVGYCLSRKASKFDVIGMQRRVRVMWLVL